MAGACWTASTAAFPIVADGLVVVVDQRESVLFATIPNNAMGARKTTAVLREDDETARCLFFFDGHGNPFDGLGPGRSWTCSTPFELETGVLPGGFEALQLGECFSLVFSLPLELVDVALFAREPGVNFKSVPHRLVPFAFVASAASAPREASAEVGFVDRANHGQVLLGGLRECRMAYWHGVFGVVVDRAFFIDPVGTVTDALTVGVVQHGALTTVGNSLWATGCA